MRDDEEAIESDSDELEIEENPDQRLCGASSRSLDTTFDEHELRKFYKCIHVQCNK